MVDTQSPFELSCCKAISSTTSMWSSRRCSSWDRIQHFGGGLGPSLFDLLFKIYVLIIFNYNCSLFKLLYSNFTVFSLFFLLSGVQRLKHPVRLWAGKPFGREWVEPWRCPSWQCGGSGGWRGCGSHAFCVSGWHAVPPYESIWSMMYMYCIVIDRFRLEAVFFASCTLKK